ncbi:MAG TPA: hypothetical protein PLX08_12680 [Bacteroidales bacterium]|jgi:hypothetical protein|nr:hypothetical protein [Bacteroidales bacterium]
MTQDLSYRRMLHRMGYYNYQRGLIYHHLAEEGSWNGHLINCRNFILKAIGEFKPSVVTVLGSGWLLDLPLAEMVENDCVINLVDIVHPPEVKDQVKDFANVTLKEDDVSGGLIGEVWKKAGKRTIFNRLKTISDIEVNEYKPGFDPGMVISLNILTQLEILPVSLLIKKSKVNADEIVNFRKRVQQMHLQFLKKHRAVLITDCSEVIRDSSGRSDEIPSLLADLPEAIVTQEWTWNFDLRKSDYYRKKSVFKVKALMI